jgi:hypothetical protein
MPWRSRPQIVLVLGALLAATISACGEDDAELLAGETAREITANLDAVQNLADEGDCVGAESAALQVSEQIEALSDVDRRLKQALSEGADRLNEVVAECEEEPVEAVEPAEAPSDEENEPDEEEKEDEKEKDSDEMEDREDDFDDSEEGSEDESERQLPPQANGEGKGLEEGNGNGPPSGGEAEVPPSGGVGPGSPVDEGD